MACVGIRCCRGAQAVNWEPRPRTRDERRACAAEHGTRREPQDTADTSADTPSGCPTPAAAAAPAPPPPPLAVPSTASRSARVRAVAASAAAPVRRAFSAGRAPAAAAASAMASEAALALAPMPPAAAPRSRLRDDMAPPAATRSERQHNCGAARRCVQRTLDCHGRVRRRRGCGHGRWSRRHGHRSSPRRLVAAAVWLVQPCCFTKLFDRRRRRRRRRQCSGNRCDGDAHVACKTQMLHGQARKKTRLAGGLKW